MIARRHQRVIALEQCRVQLIGAFNRRLQNRRAHAVELPSAGVQHQQPLRGKRLGVEIPEGLGEGPARLVGSSQSLHRVGRPKQFPRLIHQREN